METKFDIVDEYSIGIKCLFCKHDKLQFPIFVACKPGDYSFFEISCKSCHKKNYVNFHIVHDKAFVSVTDSEP